MVRHAESLHYDKDITPGEDTRTGAKHLVGVRAEKKRIEQRDNN